MYEQSGVGRIETASILPPAPSIVETPLPDEEDDNREGVGVPVIAPPLSNKDIEKVHRAIREEIPSLNQVGRVILLLYF